MFTAICYFTILSVPRLHAWWLVKDLEGSGKGLISQPRYYRGISFDNLSKILKMKACSAKTSVSGCKTTRCCNPEHYNLNEQGGVIQHGGARIARPESTCCETYITSWNCVYMISSSLETKFSCGFREVCIQGRVAGSYFCLIYGVRRSFCDNRIWNDAELEEGAMQIREVSTANRQGWIG